MRKERLEASGLAPGPWLTRLKTLIAAGEHSTLLTLPDAREAAAGRLAEEFILEGPGIRLAYATDLADTGPNRDRLARVAAEGGDCHRARSLFSLVGQIDDLPEDSPAVGRCRNSADSP